MGCDEHMFVERWHNSEWVPVDPPNDESKGWNNWGRCIEPESDLKLLGDAGKDFADIIPENANEWNFGRNYEAFGQLADVRGGGPAFIERRGLPDDISAQLIKVFFSDTEGRWEDGKPIEYEGTERWPDPDMHSTHWYDLLELRGAVHERGARNVEKRILQLAKELEKVAKKYNLGPLDVRIVFGFDN